MRQTSRHEALVLTLIPLSLLYANIAWAHGGGLDEFGCHHNRKHGGYHCHRGLFAGKSFESKVEMITALKILDAKDKAPVDTNQLHAAPSDGKEKTCIRDRFSGKIKCGKVVTP